MCGEEVKNTNKRRLVLFGFSQFSLLVNVINGV